MLMQAKPEETEEILELYNDLLDKMEVNYPRWTKNVYPDLKYLNEMAEQGYLYIARLDERIVSAMILNNQMNADYEKIPWSVTADKDKILSIHTFMVVQEMRGQELGLKIIEQIKRLAKAHGIETIRIDTIKGNDPAVHFYEKAGFTNMGMHELHYDETPERFFTLFEYNLEDFNE